MDGEHGIGPGALSCVIIAFRVCQLMQASTIACSVLFMGRAGFVRIDHLASVVTLNLASRELISNRRVTVISGLCLSRGDTMDPFIVEVSRQIDNYQSREEIMRILDELEFLFEALDEEQQDACSRLMSLLEERLRSQD